MPGLCEPAGLRGETPGTGRKEPERLTDFQLDKRASGKEVCADSRRKMNRGETFKESIFE